MLVAKIDRDYLFDPNDPNELLYNRKGEHWQSDEFPGTDFTKSPIVRFRCKDDDGEIYYGGWLMNDDDCAVQWSILKWTMKDSGCTSIEIKVNDEWIQEIS